MAASSLVYVGIAPHPPIMVPEVGRGEAARVRDSIEAMREMTARISACGAETVVLISPHAPLDARAFVAYRDSELRGDFARFRARDAEISAPLDSELLDSISRAAAEDGLGVAGLEGEELDHGTAVPLYFLLRNGWRGRVVALGYSFLSDEDHVRFGASLRRAVETVGRPAAFVASGDLSHRLTPDAPAGYEPDAHLFDEEVIESIRASSPRRVIGIDQNLRRRAGECGYRSVLVALGASEGVEPACEVLSYEAPFGVGYLVAQLARRSAAAAGEDGEGLSSPQSEGEVITSLARRAVETHVREGRAAGPPEDLPPALRRPAACFVSIKTDDGELRGCIGTVEPARRTLAEELLSNAVSAATRDPRFPPVEPSELSSLRYSVDILSEPEPARLEDLDPKIYGVIVEDEHGLRRGLLLPDIEGVETVSRQVEIASRKAGISAQEPLRLYRFRVERFRELPSPEQTSEQGA
ncbi:MAG: AmmeMemoRadiSam system protein A [Acidobacteria bacterium]|nr:AmmeMemoRadiSam system protein A [Acidobacteriota bacterium]